MRCGRRISELTALGGLLPANARGIPEPSSRPAQTHATCAALATAPTPTRLSAQNSGHRRSSTVIQREPRSPCLFSHRGLNIGLHGRSKDCAAAVPSHVWHLLGGLLRPGRGVSRVGSGRTLLGEGNAQAVSAGKPSRGILPASLTGHCVPLTGYCARRFTELLDLQRARELQEGDTSRRYSTMSSDAGYGLCERRSPVSFYVCELHVYSGEMVLRVLRVAVSGCGVCGIFVKFRGRGCLWGL